MKINFNYKHFGTPNQGFLTVEEVVEVLSRMGYANLSIWVVRRYVSQGLIDQPIHGVPVFADRGTKYRAYYRPQAVHEIAEIRDMLSAGYKVSGLMSQRVHMSRFKEDTVEDTNWILELVDEYVSKISSGVGDIEKLDEEIIKLRKEMIKLNEISKHDLKLLRDCTFGNNPKPGHKKILKNYLDKKFNKKGPMKT